MLALCRPLLRLHVKNNRTFMCVVKVHSLWSCLTLLIFLLFKIFALVLFLCYFKPFLCYFSLRFSRDIPGVRGGVVPLAARDARVQHQDGGVDGDSE